MKTFSMLAGALGCAALAAQLVDASPATAGEAVIRLAQSSHGAGFAGFPGGQGGASGRVVAGLPAAHTTTRQAGDPLRGYCIGLLKAKRPRLAAAHTSSFRPRNCAGLFTRVAQAQPGQPGRGGDGGGFPGVPGGRGGASGGLPGLPLGPGQPRATPDDIAVDPTLINYCVDVLQSRGRAFSDEYAPSDCAYYLLALDRAVSGRSRNLGPSYPGSGPFPHDGPDGPSIGGGIGGQGGRAGSGPGGGRGGAGGAGVGGGLGGAGGAGGASR